MSLFDDLTKSKSLKNIINTLSSQEDNEEQLKLMNVLKNESKELNNNEKEYLVKTKIFKVDEDYPFNLFKDSAYFKYNELEFFKSNDNDSENTLFNKINHTSSTLGKYKLIEILTNPINDIHKLNQRKILIEKCSKLKEKCKSLSKIESNILWFFKDTSEEIDNMLEMIYFNDFWNRWINDYKNLLNIYFNFKLIIIPLYGLLFPILIIFIPYLIVTYIFKLKIPFSFYWKNVKSVYFSGTGVTSLISQFSGFYNFTNDNSDLSGKLITFIFKSFNKILKSGLGNILYYCFTIFSYVYGFYTTLDYSYSYLKIIKFFKEKLNKISEFVFEIKQIFNENKYFENDELKEKFHNKLNNDTINTISLIDYKKPISYVFSNKGEILKYFNYIQKNFNELKPFIEYYSYLDAWSSISLLKDYSKPLFIKNHKPYIKLEQFGNIGLDNSIKNDIILRNKNLIITGPNASGKSTFLKSIITNIILSQTICLSHSKKMIITPFTHINTYLNIPDCQGKESLFQAEMNRCYNQIDLLKQMKKDEFVFTIMDEIFVSTNYQEGVSGAYAICKKMATFPNSLCIVSTHFPVLCKVFDKNNLFKNYYFSIEKNNKKTYKVKEGYSKQHFALELLNRKGFDKDILDNSKKMFEYLNKKI